MRVNKCDVCKKEIKESRYAVMVRFDWKVYEFCENCNIPVVKLLEKKKLIKKEK